MNPISSTALRSWSRRFGMLVLFWLLVSASAQGRPPEPSATLREYRSPVPGARWVGRQETLLFRLNDVSAHSPVNIDEVRWTVRDDQQRTMPGHVERSLEGGTWRWYPDAPLPESARLESRVDYTHAGVAASSVWQFTVRPAVSPTGFSADEETAPVPERWTADVDDHSAQVGTLDLDTIPLAADFVLPHFISGEIRSSADRATGTVYIAPFPWGDELTPFRMTIDDSNHVDYYRAQEYNIESFFPYRDKGLVTLYDGGFVLYDTTMTPVDTLTIIDTLAISSPYNTDFHDLRLLPDGHFLLLGGEMREMDLSDSLDGGQEVAAVVGTVIEELDAEHQPVFLWKALDTQGISILDAEGYYDLTGTHVDFMHSNSLDIWSDGNIIVSVRHFSQVMKIDRLTGELLWRFGGHVSDFDYGGGSPFLLQHDARLLENGNLLVFDNNGLGENPSKVVEYQLDEENMTAALIWSYQHPSGIASINRGNSRRLSNGNTFIGWGGTGSTIMATEVTPAGDIVWELELDRGELGGHYVSYQVHKVEMGLAPETPELFVETVDVDVKTLLYAYFGTEEVTDYIIWSWTLGIPAVALDTISATAFPLKPEYFQDEETYFAVQARFAGGGTSEMSQSVLVQLNELGRSEPNTPASSPEHWALVQSWPNPFNQSTTVQLQLQARQAVDVALFNTTGQLVREIHRGPLDAGVHSWALDTRSLASGVYFLWVRDRGGRAVARKISLVR